MIRDFETWSSTYGEASQLEELQGTRVGIEAAHYLDHRIMRHGSNKEPLVPALGGLPLGFRAYVETDLDAFAAFQLQPLFVFSGLDIAKQDDPFRRRQEGAIVNNQAWGLYDNHEAEKSVQKFGESRTSTYPPLPSPSNGRATADHRQPTSFPRTISAHSSLFWPKEGYPS